VNVTCDVLKVIALREVAGAGASGFTSKMSPLHLITFANGESLPCC